MLKLLKVDEVASIMGLSKSLVNFMIEIKMLPVLKLGPVVRVRQKDLDKYIERERVWRIRRTLGRGL